MKKSNITDLVQVNKAVLTPEAIKCLEFLQAENNYVLNAIRDDIANVVCLLGQCITMLDEDYRVEVSNAIAALSQTRKTINELKTLEP